MEILLSRITSIPTRLKKFEPSYFRLSDFAEAIRSIGRSSSLDDYEARKLGIFNLLNFFQLITGVLMPMIGLMHNDRLPGSVWMLACLPSMLSLAVLILNHLQKYHQAQLAYFILYPFFTGFVYMQGLNSGVELHFILYGVLAVFFLQDMGYMLFTIALTMINYFLLSVLLKDFIYEVKHENVFLYLFNHILALAFIFYGLYLIKKENTGYQVQLLEKQEALRLKNEEITELNALKTKLFSIISHDLKSPVYAVRNLFRNMQDMPAENVKQYIPEVLNDLNYTIGLMDNLLIWSRSQMESGSVHPQEIDLEEMICDVHNIIRLQAEAKQIHLRSRAQEGAMAWADRDMVHLVLRNLVSNAIKFTPEAGEIEIGVYETDEFTEVYVKDSGYGITPEAIRKINAQTFYSTKGTSSESGTGLGLMLCKDFLVKNGGRLHIDSEPGSGSTFSFTLPRAMSNAS